MDEETEFLIWVKNAQIRSPWQAAILRPYLCRHLIDPIRAVMGFWEHPAIPIKDKAAMCGLYAGEFIALNRMLYGSNLGAVRFCLRFELPASASVELKKPFRCAGCGGMIKSLPCVQCWDGPDDDPHV